MLKFSAISQTSPIKVDTDADSTTCLANAKLRTAIRLIERGRLDSVKVGLLESRLALKDSQLLVKDRIIQTWEQTNINSERLFNNYEREVANLDRQNNQREIIITGLQGELRRQKRKTVWGTIAGAVAAGTISYLVLK